MKTLLSFLFVLFSIISFSQRTAKHNDDKQSYHHYRLRLTVPPYGIARIRALIPKIKSDGEDNEALSAKDYESLSLREKVTYHMSHAESYSQKGDQIAAPKNEKLKIFANIPDAFEE